MLCGVHPEEHIQATGIYRVDSTCKNPPQLGRKNNLYTILVFRCMETCVVLNFQSHTRQRLPAPLQVLSFDMLINAEKDNLNGKSGPDEHGGYRAVFDSMGLQNDDDRRVCSLNQHPIKHFTAAHADESLPTFLASSQQKLWSFKHRRWLSSVEKFTAMGWPTTKELAKILGRPVVFPRMCNAHERIGNGMHVFNCVALLLAVLGSIEIMEPVPQKACVFCFLGWFLAGACPTSS